MKKFCQLLLSSTCAVLYESACPVFPKFWQKICQTKDGNHEHLSANHETGIFSLWSVFSNRKSRAGNNPLFSIQFRRKCKHIHVYTPNPRHTSCATLSDSRPIVFASFNQTWKHQCPSVFSALVACFVPSASFSASFSSSGFHPERTEKSGAKLSVRNEGNQISAGSVSQSSASATDQIVGVRFARQVALRRAKQVQPRVRRAAFTFSFSFVFLLCLGNITGDKEKRSGQVFFSW